MPRRAGSTEIVRIVAGSNRGRALMAPKGASTRPTADRARQAIFDQLAHAPWFGRAALERAVVLDAFAGTGALGLEALSRGAARARFIERDRAALAALRANIAACRAEDRARVLAGDVTAPPRAPEAHDLVFLDPPYGKGLVTAGLRALARAGWLARGALIVAETGAEAGADEDMMPPDGHDFSTVPPDILSERVFGAARVTIFRLAFICP